MADAYRIVQSSDKNDTFLSRGVISTTSENFTNKHGGLAADRYNNGVDELAVGTTGDLLSYGFQSLKVYY